MACGYGVLWKTSQGTSILPSPWTLSSTVGCWASVRFYTSIYSLEPTAERHWLTQVSLKHMFLLEPSSPRVDWNGDTFAKTIIAELLLLVKTTHRNQGCKTVSGSGTANKTYEKLCFCSLVILGFSPFKSNHEPPYHIYTYPSVRPFECPFSCLEFGSLTPTLEAQAQPLNQVRLHQLYKQIHLDHSIGKSEELWNTYTLNLDKYAAEVSLRFLELNRIRSKLSLSFLVCQMRAPPLRDLRQQFPS